MKILYLDLLSGLSGDMFLGGLVDLGVELEKIERGLAKLNLDGYHLHARKRSTWEIRGTKFDVHVDGHEHGHDQAGHHHHHDGEEARGHAHPHDHGHDHAHAHPHPHADAHPQHQAERSFARIQELIHHSSLSPWVRQKSLAVFRRLAEAEGKVHGCPPEEVHFHEVGAVDSIVDIVGACVALEALGKPRVAASPVVEGRGWVECAHGRFPVPAPATLEILAARGVALGQCDEPQEMLTPTGAALLAELAESFGLMPPMQIERIGYGLGSRALHTRPNSVRLVLGEATAKECVPVARDWDTDQVAVLETNLDDLNPEILGGFVEKALNHGALEVFYTPVTMKKNRPGVLLTLLCPLGEAEAFTTLILRETSAFGVRCHTATRRKLRRTFSEVPTPWGPVRVKLGWLNNEIVQAAPEYDSCRAVAEGRGVPVRQVYAAALHQAAPVPKKPGRKKKR